MGMAGLFRLYSFFATARELTLSRAALADRR
jgi:hypothetical protein